MQFADIAAALRAHWRLSIVIVVLTAVVLAGFLTTREEVQPPPRYRVEVQLFVPAPAEDAEEVVGVPQVLLSGQSRLALADETKAAALDAAGIPEDERSRVAFGYRQSETGRTLTLVVTARDPEVATVVGRTFRDAYVSSRRDRVEASATGNQDAIRLELERLRAQLALVESQLRETAPEALAPPTPNEDGELVPSTLPPNADLETVLLAEERAALQQRIRQAQTDFGRARIDALLPTAYAQTVEILPPVQIVPAAPSPVMPALAIIGVGLALAAGVPVLRDRLDHTIRSPATAARVFEAPILAAIPAAPRRRRRTLARPGTEREDAYRSLAATSVATDRLPSAIVVTSPTGEAQDVVAANLAAALARLGVRVALLATEPRQGWYLEHAEVAEDQLTFPELLERAHDGRLNGAVPKGLARTDLANLVILPPGADEAAVELHGLAPLLEALATGGTDVTVIAGPAFLEDPDATIFSWTTRSVLWVFESGSVTEAQAAEATARLALAGATPFGVVMLASKR